MIHNGKAGFIDDQDGRFLTQLLKGVGAQIIAHPIRIPDGLREQALHAIRTRFSGMFSQLPTVLSGDVTQDPLQVGQHPATWLWSGKARGQTGMQTSKFLRPMADIDRGRSGSVEGDMLVVLHGLLLSSEVAEDGCYIHSVPHERKKLLKPFSCFGKSFMVQLIKCDCSDCLIIHNLSTF